MRSTQYPPDLQVSIILPSNTTIPNLEPSLDRLGPSILEGFREASRRKLLHPQMFYNLTFRDSRCDNSFAPKAFTDAIVEGVHVVFGPSCEYSLGKLYTHTSFKAEQKRCVEIDGI